MIISPTSTEVAQYSITPTPVIGGDYQLLDLNTCGYVDGNAGKSDHLALHDVGHD